MQYTYCNVHIALRIGFDSKSTSMAELNKIMDVLNFMVYYCKHVKKGTKGSPGPQFLDMLLILSPCKKTCKSRDEYALSAYNVNSGFSQFDNTHGKVHVCIYRKEEIVKVLIHELLHSLCMDYKGVFPASIVSSANEGFTDAYACLLNVCLKACMSTTSTIEFHRVLAKEKRHIMRIGGRVASILQLKNTTETTNITAYYVLKAMHFEFIDEFIKYLCDDGYYLQSPEKYTSFVINCYNKTHSYESPSIKLAKSFSLRMSSVDVLEV